MDAETVLAAAAIGATGKARAGQRFDDLAVLTGTCVAFALGFASLEQAKHPDRAQVGPVAGIEVLPELRTLRPRLAEIADHCDPLGLQRSLAAAMLQAEPNLSGVYFVDEHFMPYSGAKAGRVGLEHQAPSRRARPGRHHHLRPQRAGGVLHQRRAVQPGQVDAGRSQAATADPRPRRADPARLRPGRGLPGGIQRPAARRGAHWVAYRRAPLAVPTRLPIVTTITHPHRKPTTIAYTDETVTINKYGQARQITLFEHGKPVLQILTSDTTTCPAALVLFMRARWRIENLFKYLDFYGIDYLADYHFTIEANTRKVDNPERKKLKAELKKLTAERDAHRERIGAAHTDRDRHHRPDQPAVGHAQRRIQALDKQIEDLTDTAQDRPRQTARQPDQPRRRARRSTAPTAAPYRWCYACSPPTPRTGSPTTSTPICRTTTSTAQPPATSCTWAAPSPTPNSDHRRTRPAQHPTPGQRRRHAPRRDQPDLPPHPRRPPPNHLHPQNMIKLNSRRSPASGGSPAISVGP